MIQTLHSVARWCYLHRVPFIPELIRKTNFVLFGALVPPQCRIGAGTKLHHHALCTIIHPDTEIGRDCNIYTQVVIGGAHDGPDGPPIRIIIGNRVNISCGAKVLCKSGTLRIGDGSTIAANAVVLSDVPPDALAIGIPAHCIPKRRRQAAA